MLRLCSAILCSLALSACTATTGVIAPRGPGIPDSLLTCAPEPPKPEGEYTQRDVAVYIVQLRAAMRDCKGDLASVKNLLDKYERRLEKLKKENGNA